MAVARGPRAARTEDVRRSNLATLLRYVHLHGPTSRSLLTTELRLNRSTIGDLTSGLAAAGLVREEVGPPPGARTVGGRPSHVVVPQTESVQVLAVDIGVSHLTVARVGLGGVILDRRDLHQRREHRAVEEVVEVVAAESRELLAALPFGAVCVGAGAAVPGLVRASDGLVRHAPNLGWVDVPLGERLSRALGVPVAIGNDADVGALAEHSRGVAVGCDDLVYLAGHAGIGAGVFMAGHPVSGHRGYAGEVGHIRVNPHGADCRCGSGGCWETEAGEERLLALAGRPAHGGLEAVREVVAAAAAGDEPARKALREVATWLGVGTAAVINLLNPQMVVLGGALAEVFTAAGSHVRAAVDAAVLSAPREDVVLAIPAFGSDSTLVGAAELAFAPLLADPLTAIGRLRD